MKREGRVMQGSKREEEERGKREEERGKREERESREPQHRSQRKFFSIGGISTIVK